VFPLAVDAFLLQPPVYEDTSHNDIARQIVDINEAALGPFGEQEPIRACRIFLGFSPGGLYNFVLLYLECQICPAIGGLWSTGKNA